MHEHRFFRPDWRLWPNVDWPLIAVAPVLSLIGIMTIWGASGQAGDPGPFTGYPRMQLIWTLVGLTALTTLLLLHYRWSKRWAWVLYALLIAALVYLHQWGEPIKGAKSWLVFWIAGRRLQFQPAEFGKVIVVITLARYLSGRMPTFRKFIHTLAPLGIIGAPMALIALQPDIGTAAVFLPVGFAMFFVAGIRKRVLAAYALLALAAVILGYPHLKPYQKQRIETFIRPGEDQLAKGWNIIQAQAALGSGGMFGKGWAQGTQTSFRFLPEYQTDFVFPSLGEQFGFFGCLVVIALYALLLIRMAWLAGRTHDPYGMLLVTGLASILAVHIIMNIGMSTGLLPVTGLPLPFFSYGGSFMLTCYAMIGLALSVGARREA